MVAAIVEPRKDQHCHIMRLPKRGTGPIFSEVPGNRHVNRLATSGCATFRIRSFMSLRAVS